MSTRQRKRLAISRAHAPSSDRWLLSYADFVTLLLAVFMVLFAYSWRTKQSIKAVSASIHTGFDSMSATAPDTHPPAKELPPAAKQNVVANVGFDVRQLSNELKGVLGEEISKREIVVQQTSEGLVVSLRELGFFHSGDAMLLPGAAEKLIRTAQVLKRQGLDVRVEGHSDDHPIHNAAFDSNWQLSTARAMTVLSLLVDRGDFPPTKISVAGYGPYKPVADNTTPEGRQMNRRVDLVILAPKISEQHLP